MITTVVFDLDDTLYDEIDYCRSGFVAVAQFLADQPDTPSAERIFAAMWRQFASGNRSRTFNAALDELGVGYDQRRIGELIDVYRNHVPKIELPADSRDILAELSTKYTLALLTDGFLPAQQLKVQALGIERYFAHIVYTEELGRDCWKPSAAGFEKVLQSLSIRPDNTLYVADNENKDFIAPNRLGFVTVQLLRRNRIHTSTCPGQPGSEPRHVIRQIGQLPPLLDRL